MHTLDTHNQYFLVRYGRRQSMLLKRVALEIRRQNMMSLLDRCSFIWLVNSLGVSILIHPLLPECRTNYRNSFILSDDNRKKREIFFLSHRFYANSQFIKTYKNVVKDVLLTDFVNPSEKKRVSDFPNKWKSIEW